MKLYVLGCVINCRQSVWTKGEVGLGSIITTMSGTVHCCSVLRILMSDLDASGRTVAAASLNVRFLFMHLSSKHINVDVYLAAARWLSGGKCDENL